MTPTIDLRVGSWIGTRDTRGAGTVGYFVPAAAPVVMRVLHRVKDVGTGELLRWDDVVDTSPLEGNPGSQFHDLSSTQPKREVSRGYGELDSGQLAGLIEGARGAQVSERIYVGVWVGTSAVPRSWEGLPVFSGAGRDCYLVESSLDELEEANATDASALNALWSPYCWWSSDGSLFVTTDIDLDSTFVATTEDVAAHLEQVASLEMVRISRSRGVIA